MSSHDPHNPNATGASIGAEKCAGAALIPIDEEYLYYAVVSDMLRAVQGATADSIRVSMDVETAGETDGWRDLCQAGHAVTIYGTGTLDDGDFPSLALRPRSPGVEEYERFVVIRGCGVRLAALGHLETTATGHSFNGGWSPDADIVEYAAAALGEDGALPLETATADPHTSNLSVHLCAMHIRHVTSRQRVMATSKHDLFSVLNILKAISAKRRAHDILFVFVESIARVVPMSRCSVVRVWGGDSMGHVLASHEDKRVSDLPIALEKYPEIQRALDDSQKVVISDVARDPLTQPFVTDLGRANIQAIVVIPIVLFDETVGSLLLRGARSDGPFSSREISFCEIVAEAAANALERAHLFESIQKANEGLEHLAVTDGLTGLYNHRYFRDRLADEFERATRYKLPLSCLILDVDNFKRINDTFGHLRGDAVLKEMSARVMRSVRKPDIVARYGGEEIVVIMPQTGAEGALAQAERIRRKIGELPFGEGGNAIRVTVSIGVGVLQHGAMQDCEALIREADSALYEAKAAGKNKVVVGGTS